MKIDNVNKLIYVCMICVSTIPAFAQHEQSSLVIRIDDMGAFHSVNTACMETYKNGIAQSVEVMPVAAWFPEAVKMLKENPGLDVGVHLVVTSEWENAKWRPLTHCPSLTDENGYFRPMLFPNPNYPGQAIIENKWNLEEIEKEFRAQIETTLKNLPQTSHISGHMFSYGFDDKVYEMALRLADEYNLSVVDRDEQMKKYNYTYINYDGPKKTSAEKENSFINAINKLEPGKQYMFVDHPAFNNDEMKTVFHIGYEDVAVDRQGVTDILTSPRVKQAIQEKGVKLISINALTKSLPRTEMSGKLSKAMDKYLKAVEKSQQDLHSIMIVQHGNVLAEKWLGEGVENKPHILNSVSKTFTATAIGFAVAEGKLKVTDKVISFFPDKLPAEISPNLKKMEIRHLLTMSCGHDTDPTGQIQRQKDADWVQAFLATPVEHEPGSYFVYNSVGTYMLSAIIQKVTGQKVIDYLSPRLFRPLGITGAYWQESPQGINCGGWGLFLKTEDLAKMGQFFLQKGEWNGKQLLPVSWIDEATTSKIASYPSGTRPENLKMKPKDSDWLQGYGYQMWRCRHNGVRADGADGQYIIILPEKDAVIVATAHIGDMQAELNLIWKHLLPCL
ncbi:ChbG/HpnK family deacetylase [Parabacteroides sp. AM08-6]|uniref:ChbG/HpnK family deacetylase n=1 Tax=Parabacteroides sp. AM08-6 TaxID=2292053 RepID=UPI000EFE2793|nr:ChbG/HpnK family deacetylase [Parabacteroides sp. AM08-6]RHJ87779.1 ChbG/HpnK family deacetylase [Parabacteroides sp. AM08-6]